MVKLLIVVQSLAYKDKIGVSGYKVLNVANNQTKFSPTRNEGLLSWLSTLESLEGWVVDSHQVVKLLVVVQSLAYMDKNGMSAYEVLNVANNQSKFFTHQE